MIKTIILYCLIEYPFAAQMKCCNFFIFPFLKGYLVKLVLLL